MNLQTKTNKANANYASHNNQNQSASANAPTLASPDRITSPDAVVYKPNQSDEELQEQARAKSIKYMEACSMEFIEVSFKRKSERMEEKFTYPPEYSQSQNQRNNIQAGPASANGPSQPSGSNPVQGNPPSPMRSGVKKFLCLRN